MQSLRLCSSSTSNAHSFFHWSFLSLTSWIHSYLYHRSQQVVLNGSSSHKSHASSGVPPGSILGPLLFINSLSDIPLSPSSKLVLYADDILYSHSCNSPSDISLVQFVFLLGFHLTTLLSILLRLNICSFLLNPPHFSVLSHPCI